MACENIRMTRGRKRDMMRCRQVQMKKEKFMSSTNKTYCAAGRSTLNKNQKQQDAE